MGRYVRKTKDCTRCEKRKSLSEFYTRSGKSSSHCKECERKDARYRMSRESNKLRIALRDSKKVAKKYGCVDDLTYDDVAYTFAIAGNRCAYCGDISNKLELEHIVPLSRRGWNSLCNITTSCQKCNQRKKTDAILNYATLNVRDNELVLSIIDRIAFRMGNDRSDVLELLEAQQDDYMHEDLARYFERRKARQSKS